MLAMVPSCVGGLCAADCLAELDSPGAASAACAASAPGAALARCLSCCRLRLPALADVWPSGTPARCSSSASSPAAADAAAASALESAAGKGAPVQQSNGSPAGRADWCLRQALMAGSQKAHGSRVSPSADFHASPGIPCQACHPASHAAAAHPPRCSRSKRKRCIKRQPACAARSHGVWPCLLRAVRAAPASTRQQTAASWPLLAAKWRG
ncbi:hypothetical protein ABPG75_013780 [Micractinium tetrahymenae]